MRALRHTKHCLWPYWQKTAWTDEQFQLISRAANKVCFLPDDDPPKDGQSFGTGIETVMKAGKSAMEHHLSVSIKEIPDDEHQGKKDPDSYYTDMDIFRKTEEVDYVLWMADKLFPLCENTEQKSDVIKQLAYLLSLIDDDTKVSLYINSLTKYNKSKVIWKKAIEYACEQKDKSSNEKHVGIQLNKELSCQCRDVYVKRVVDRYRNRMVHYISKAFDRHLQLIFGRPN